MLGRVRDECSPQLGTARGRSGHRQEPARAGAVRGRRAGRRPADLASGGRCLPYGERGSACGHSARSSRARRGSSSPTVPRRHMRSCRPLSPASSRTPRIESGSRTDWLRSWALRPPRRRPRRSGTSHSPRGDGSSSCSRTIVRWCSCSRTFTGRTTRCSISSTSSQIELWRHPLLVLCTTRPELLARRPGWGGGKSNSLTVTLQPLSDSETETILAAMLEGPLDAPTREALLSRAAGNPLYAEQFARSLTEVGTVDELPDTVHGIIAGRLDGLPAAEKTLPQDAAVVGKVFWLGALESMDGASAPRPMSCCTPSSERSSSSASVGPRSQARWSTRSGTFCSAM